MDLLKRLMEGTHDAVYLCMFRRDARGGIQDMVVLDANERGFAELGLRRDELIGKGLRELFTSVELLNLYRMCLDVAVTGRTHEATYSVSNVPRPGRYHVRIVATDDGVLVCTRWVSEQPPREVTEVKRKISDAPSDRAVPVAHPRTGTVLVVDDEPAIRRALGATLRAAGYVVLEAADGSEALDVLATEEADLVISDVRMPRVDGFQLAETLHTTRPELPVYLLSGWASAAELAERGLDATRLLEKPIDAQRLLDVVASVVGRKVSAAS